MIGTDDGICPLIICLGHVETPLARRVQTSAHLKIAMPIMPIVNRLVCRERELAAVKVDVKDVDFIVQQLEVSKDAADRSLREHKVRLVLW